MLQHWIKSKIFILPKWLYPALKSAPLAMWLIYNHNRNLSIALSIYWLFFNFSFIGAKSFHFKSACKLGPCWRKTFWYLWRSYISYIAKAHKRIILRLQVIVNLQQQIVPCGKLETCGRKESFYQTDSANELLCRCSLRYILNWKYTC